jgi:phenylalanyl-tRNA synthetase beta chain
MYRLVTSLVPHLIKNVHVNATHKDSYSFFEVNKIWHKEESPKVSVTERTALAGIFFDAIAEINFYQKKEILSELFRSLGMDVTWQKAQSVESWFHPYQTAELFLNQQSIGFAGIANPTMLQTVVPGSAFIFELNGDILFDVHMPQQIAKPLPKYQDSWRDISMLVPLSVTVQQLKELIMKASPAIVSVVLIDFFQKDEWHDVRSVTMRFYVRNEERTLVSEEVDAVNDAVVERLKTLGATIR